MVEADEGRAFATRGIFKGEELVPDQLPVSGRYFSVELDKMAANPFTRGTYPGRARPPHRGSFKMGHEKRGGRKKGTPAAISLRTRKAIAAAAKRIARGSSKLNHHHWQRLIDNNPLITKAYERQGKFTLTGAPRFRSRQFNMKSICKDLSAVAMHAIQTDQFVDQDLVQCLTLLAVRDPSEFAKFLALTLPKQSYLAARPHAEVPREAVNPGEYRRPPIPEWTLGFDPTLNSWTPVPVDPALTPQDAHHEVCGSPPSPAPGWDWKFDSEARRFRAIALRPKTPIPEWTASFDPKLATMTPVPVYDLYEYDAEWLLFKRYQRRNLVVRKSSLNPKHRRVDGSLYGTQTALTL